MIPVFIGGTGRSGTTIIKRALALRPDFVSFRLEIRIIVDPDGILDLIRALDEDWSPYKADLAIKRFRKLLRKTQSTSIWKRALRRAMFAVGISPPSYVALGLEEQLEAGALVRAFEPVLEKLSSGVSPGGWIGSPGGQIPPRIIETEWISRSESAPMFGTALQSLFAQLPGADKATAFVEDTPFNLLHARELFDLFPDMYLINVYRDPRDIAASYMGKVWGGKEIRLTSQRIRAILNRWKKLRDDLPADRVFDIALEDLAQDSEKTLQPFYQALSIEPGETRSMISVEKANIGRWRRNLTAEQICVVEEIFGPSELDTSITPRFED